MQVIILPLGEAVIMIENISLMYYIIALENFTKLIYIHCNKSKNSRVNAVNCNNLTSPSNHKPPIPLHPSRSLQFDMYPFTLFSMTIYFLKHTHTQARTCMWFSLLIPLFSLSFFKTRMRATLPWNFTICITDLFPGEIYAYN